MAPKNRFLSLEPLNPGARITLSEEESHHLLHVLRLTVGEEILLIDGKGGLAEGKVESAAKRSVAVTVGKIQNIEFQKRVHLVFGVTKAPALEFILHRVTEVGVASFQPLNTQHSLRLSSWNEERWRKIVMETIKQCEESHLPEIYAPLDLKIWLEKRNKDRALFLCDETDREIRDEFVPSQGAEVLVGPEGGWSSEELELLRHHGAKALSLGVNRLRAETACLVAVTLVKKIFGEL